MALTKVKGSGLATGAATASLVGIDDNATSTAITIDASETTELKCQAGDANVGAKIYHPTSTSARHIVKFQSNVGGTQVDKAVIDCAGNVNVNSGNLVIGTSGKGIDFSADGNAGGMTSEVLDDYETGTWTPVYGSSGTAPTISYSAQNGTYTKIGNTVIIGIYLNTASVSGGSGNLRITGLPFTQNSVVGGYGSKVGNIQNFVSGLTQTIGGFVNVDRIEMRRGNDTAVTTSDLRTTGDSNQIWWSLSYNTAS